MAGRVTVWGREWLTWLAQRNARENADRYSARIRLGVMALARLEGEPRRRAIAQIKHLVSVRNQWERLAADRP